MIYGYHISLKANIVPCFSKKLLSKSYRNPVDIGEETKFENIFIRCEVYINKTRSVK